MRQCSWSKPVYQWLKFLVIWYANVTFLLGNATRRLVVSHLRGRLLYKCRNPTARPRSVSRHRLCGIIKVEGGGRVLLQGTGRLGNSHCVTQKCSCTVAVRHFQARLQSGWLSIGYGRWGCVFTYRFKFQSAGFREGWCCASTGHPEDAGCTCGTILGGKSENRICNFVLPIKLCLFPNISRNSWTSIRK